MGRETARQVNAKRAAIAQMLAPMVAFMAFATANPRVNDFAGAEFDIFHIRANGAHNAFYLMAEGKRGLARAAHI